VLELDVARELGLLASGGTDYHGDGETYAEAIAETWVPPAIAEEVLADCYRQIRMRIDFNDELDNRSLRSKRH